MTATAYKSSLSTAAAPFQWRKTRDTTAEMHTTILTNIQRRNFGNCVTCLPRGSKLISADSTQRGQYHRDLNLPRTPRGRAWGLMRYHKAELGCDPRQRARAVSVAQNP